MTRTRLTKSYAYSAAIRTTIRHDIPPSLPILPHPPAAHRGLPEFLPQAIDCVLGGGAAPAAVIRGIVLEEDGE